MKLGHTGFIRLIKASQYSWRGLKAAWMAEAAFRQECVLAAILLPIAFFLEVTPLEKSLLIATVLLVIIVELINSAIEAVVDRISTEFHELSGNAKDMGSAAVLFALILMGLVWGTILFNQFFG